jgi:hypothetical protein
MKKEKKIMQPDIEISSVEEQEAANYKLWGSLTPEQRLELHHLLIMQVYGMKPGKKSTGQMLEIVVTHGTVSQ